MCAYWDEPFQSSAKRFFWKSSCFHISEIFFDLFGNTYIYISISVPHWDNCCNVSRLLRFPQSVATWGASWRKYIPSHSFHLLLFQRYDNEWQMFWHQNHSNFHPLTSILSTFAHIRDACSTVNIFIHFHWFDPLSPTFIHVHPFYPLSFNFHPLSSIIIHFHQCSFIYALFLQNFGLGLELGLGLVELGRRDSTHNGHSAYTESPLRVFMIYSNSISC